MAVSSHQFGIICYVEVVARKILYKKLWKEILNKIYLWSIEVESKKGGAGHGWRESFTVYLFYMFGCLDQVGVFFFKNE